jgi:soluble lytic murein transglycosylase-like protein
MPDLGQLANDIADRYGIPQNIFSSVIQQESGGPGPINPRTWNPAAVGTSGEQGLGQLMPAIRAKYGVTNGFDPSQNLDASARYLSDLYGKYGDWTSVLSAYNSGSPNSVPGAGYASSVLGRAGIQPSTVVGTPGSSSNPNAQPRAWWQTGLIYGGAIMVIVFLVIFGIYGTVRSPDLAG